MNLKERYGDVYRVVDDGTNDSDKVERVNCQEIRGLYGKIYPWSNDLLAVYTTSAKIGKRLERMGFQVRQRGEYEMVLVFHPEMFELVAGIIQARKKRTLSETQRASLLARLKKPKDMVVSADSLVAPAPQEGSSQPVSMFLSGDGIEMPNGGLMGVTVIPTQNPGSVETSKMDGI